MGRIGDVAVALLSRVLSRGIEGQLPAGMEVELPLRESAAGRPFIIGHPAVRPGLESQGLGQIERPFIFKEMGEPGRLDLFPEV